MTKTCLLLLLGCSFLSKISEGENTEHVRPQYSSPGALQIADFIPAAFVLGSTYKYMATLGYTNDKVGGGGDTSTVTAGFAYFPAPVENNDVPIPLQAFFGCKHDIHAIVGVVTPDGGDSETQWALGGFYTFPQMDECWTVLAEISGTPDVFGWQTGITFCATDNLQLTAAYNSAHDNVTDGDTTDVNVLVEYVLGVSSRWVDFQLSTDFADAEGTKYNTTGIGVIYYPAKTFGVGASYALQSGDSEGSTFGALASYYFGPLGVIVNWQKVSPDGEVSVSSIGMTVEYRF